MTTTLARKLALIALANGAAGCFALFTMDGYDDLRPLPLVEGESDSGSMPPADGATVTPPVPGADAGPEVDAAPVFGKLIFVTSAEFPVGVPQPGGFNGVSDANDLCKRVASLAGLPGQYKAWLSDEQGAAPGFPGRESGDPDLGTAEPFVTVDHRLVALSYGDLRDAGPRVAIAVTELGALLPDAPPRPEGHKGDEPSPLGGDCPASGLVWTGVSPRNSLSSPCANWSSGSEGLLAAAGRIVKDPKEWAFACHLSCAVKARLYCFQQ